VMTKDELKALGWRISACVHAAKVNRQKAANNDASAKKCLEDAEKECVALGVSFTHWVKRNTGLTFGEAETRLGRGMFRRRPLKRRP
jgi:hypothetical protein